LGSFERKGVDALFVVHFRRCEVRLVAVLFLLLELLLRFAFGDEGCGFGGGFRRRREFFVERSDLFVGFGFGGGFFVAGFRDLLGECGSLVFGQVRHPTRAENFDVMGMMLCVFFPVFFVDFWLVCQRHFGLRGGFDGKLGERLGRSGGFDGFGVRLRHVGVVCGGRSLGRGVE
jgi:hypothetical protein